MSSDDNDDSAAIGDQLPLVSSTGSGSRFLMHSSESSTDTTDSDSRNEMHLPDETAEKVSADEVAIIFSFLRPQHIIRLRRVCTIWRDAAKKTIVPLTLTEFRVNSVRKYNAMRVMTTVLPNLQQLLITELGYGDKYSDGEDPDEEIAARTANWTSHDIDIISRFSKLRILTIWQVHLNGRYPVLFNFPLLQKLELYDCLRLKWDLEILDGLPLLKELNCGGSNPHPHLTGSLSSLRVLKDTLEKVALGNCSVEGNFMDLADFRRLKVLNLRGNFTAVRGDIRDIREHDFPALESLSLPHTVYGGRGHALQRISDAPEVISSLYSIRKQRPNLLYYWFGELSEDSPDWYEWDDDSRKPPFRLQFVQAGSRLGWSWICCSNSGSDSDGIYTSYYDDDDDDDLSEENSSCEINWLDPEPSSESSNYEAYMEELQRIEQRINFYSGYHQPPTEDEYYRLCEGSRGQI